jgi:hypothetical protein
MTIPARPSTDKTSDDRPSPRDPRRTWARMLPRQRTFHNPAAQRLAEFADAIQSEAGWEAWLAGHPNATDPLPDPDRAG